MFDRPQRRYYVNTVSVKNAQSISRSSKIASKIAPLRKEMPKTKSILIKKTKKDRKKNAIGFALHFSLGAIQNDDIIHECRQQKGISRHVHNHNHNDNDDVENT